PVAVVPVALSSHAPVGSPSVGLMHGAHRSSSAHDARGSASLFADTAGTQRLMQTPSRPPSEVHPGGFAPPLLMSVSGGHKPVAQAEKNEWPAVGTCVAGTQCAPPHAGVQSGNVCGSAAFVAAASALDEAPLHEAGDGVGGPASAPSTPKPAECKFSSAL